jgi:hypothetical protein
VPFSLALHEVAVYINRIFLFGLLLVKEIGQSKAYRSQNEREGVVYDEEGEYKVEVKVFEA